MKKYELYSRYLNSDNKKVKERIYAQFKIDGNKVFIIADKNFKDVKNFLLQKSGKKNLKDAIIHIMKFKSNQYSGIREVRKNNNNQTESKSLKHLPTKSTTVHGKKKIFLRNQHVNPEKNIKKYVSQKWIDKTKKLRFKDKDIKSNDTITTDTVTGKVQEVFTNDIIAYFKRQKDEVFYSDGSKIRRTVNLYKKNGERLKNEEAYLKAKENPEDYKGQQADREELAYKLAVALGHDDQITPAIKRKVKGETGTASESIQDAFEDKYDEVKTTEDIQYDTRKNIGVLIKKKDPHLLKKLTFDYLIGNLDRHSGNFMVGVNYHDNGDTSYHMLGFDHGFSFPRDSNLDILRMDGFAAFMYDSASFLHEQDRDVANKLEEIKKDGTLKKFTEEIINRIGEVEARAFLKRVANVMDIYIQ